MLKVKENVDLNSICIGWDKTDIKYTLEDNMGAFIEVYVNSREIIQEGYNGLISYWFSREVLEVE